MTDKILDADELVLDKMYVVGVMKLIEKRWKDNDTALQFRIGLKAFRLALKLTPDVIFKTFWKQVLSFINALLYENAKGQARSRGERWVEVLEQIPSKIDSGDFDLDKNVQEKMKDKFDDN